MAGPRKPRPRVTGCAVLVSALLAPTTAGAASAPVITDGPTVVGEPRVAVELRAQAAWTGDPAPTAAWTWQRCTRPAGNCAAVPDAAGDRYRVRPEDVGMVLRGPAAGQQQLRVRPNARTRPAHPAGVAAGADAHAGGDGDPGTDGYGHAGRDSRAAAGRGESSTPRLSFRRPCPSRHRS